MPVWRLMSVSAATSILALPFLPLSPAHCAWQEEVRDLVGTNPPPTLPAQGLGLGQNQPTRVALCHLPTNPRKKEKRQSGVMSSLSAVSCELGDRWGPLLTFCL
jgi:hypothetical protein